MHDLVKATHIATTEMCDSPCFNDSIVVLKVKLNLIWKLKVAMLNE